MLNFAITSNTGTETFHLAPQGKQGELPGILSGGLGALSNVAGAAGGFKMAEAAISKIDSEGAFQMGGAESKVTELAGGILGAFLAHTAEQTATKMYANRDIDSGNYYNSGNQLVFPAPSMWTVPEPSQLIAFRGGDLSRRAWWRSAIAKGAVKPALSLCFLIK